MNPVRMGVMGCANIAWRAMLPAMRECPELDLRAIASRTAEKAAQFANRFHCEAVVGYENLLRRDDLDVIYMPLPTGLHHEWVLKTLDAGKHLLVEKSFALNYESAQTMVSLAREKQLLILENFLFPHHAQYRWVQDLIARGELGDIRLFRSTFGFPPLNRENYRYRAELGGGALLDAGTYVVKGATLFLGQELFLRGAVLTSEAPGGVDLYGDVMFNNAQGQIAQLSFGFNYYYQCHYELLGTKGKLSVKRAYSLPPAFRPVVHLEYQDVEQILTLPADNHYVNMLRFLAHTITRPEDFQNHWDALLVQAKLLDQIQKEGTR